MSSTRREKSQNFPKLMQDLTLPNEDAHCILKQISKNKPISHDFTGKLQIIKDKDKILKVTREPRQLDKQGNRERNPKQISELTGLHQCTLRGSPPYEHTLLLTSRAASSLELTSECSDQLNVEEMHLRLPSPGLQGSDELHFLLLATLALGRHPSKLSHQARRSLSHSAQPPE